MSRSFRLQLALRAAGTMAVALAIVSAVSVLALASVLDGDLDATAEVDSVLLGQAVWNLIDNAIRSTPRGGRIRITTRVEDHYVELAVQDTGPGFPDAMLEHVFDRFYRADRARSHAQETQGTGLGLAIVKGVAEAHGGMASAHNVGDGGARVVLGFPHRLP